MILRRAVNYGGRLYAAGENVKGKIPLDFLAILQEQEAFEEPEPAPEVQEDGEGVDPTALTLEELGKSLSSMENADAIERLLIAEQEADSPRAGAIKLIQKRLKEVKDEL